MIALHVWYGFTQVGLCLRPAFKAGQYLPQGQSKVYIQDEAYLVAVGKNISVVQGPKIIKSMVSFTLGS